MKVWLLWNDLSLEGIYDSKEKVEKAKQELQKREPWTKKGDAVGIEEREVL